MTVKKVLYISVFGNTKRRSSCSVSMPGATLSMMYLKYLDENQPEARPSGYKKNSCSNQLSLKIILLVNVRMLLNHCCYFYAGEQAKILFMPPTLKKWGAYCFRLVCVCVCVCVCMSACVRSSVRLKKNSS